MRKSAARPSGFRGHVSHQLFGDGSKSEVRDKSQLVATRELYMTAELVAETQRVVSQMMVMNTEWIHSRAEHAETCPACCEAIAAREIQTQRLGVIQFVLDNALESTGSVSNDQYPAALRQKGLGDVDSLEPEGVHDLAVWAEAQGVADHFLSWLVRQRPDMFGEVEAERVRIKRNNELLSNLLLTLEFDGVEGEDEEDEDETEEVGDGARH